MVRKVLKNMGVITMAALLLASPVLAVRAAGTEGGSTVSSGNSESDDTSSSTVTNTTTSSSTVAATESVSTPAPVETPRVVRNVVIVGDGNELVSTVEGTYSANVVSGVAVTTPLADVTTAFGASESDSVEMAVVNTAHGPAAEASINDGLARLAADKVAAVKGPAIDIEGYLNGQWMVDLSAPVSITVGIPESFREDGYDYAVLRIQEGGKVSILLDKGSDPSVISFDTDGFGVFVVVKAPAGSFNKYK